MFTGHLPELLIIAIVALVIFGPKRLPELGASVGKGIREFRQATAGLSESVTQSISEPQTSATVVTPRSEVVTEPVTTTHS